jgi:hypothetical protein
MRPSNLNEVVFRLSEGISVPLDEFIDEFYLAHGDVSAQQAMIDVEPEIVGDEFLDAYLAAVAEHLAMRWGLTTPEWTFSDRRLGSSNPVFQPDISTMRNQFLIESPYPFRRRNIFTHREPFQRARWPSAEPKIPSMFM